MSWKEYLNKHPKSVLNSELPIILLTWMERVGLTTEEDASRSLNVDQNTTHKIFLDLYKDNLIDYGRRWVCVSDKGKSLIDRFGLNKDIFEDLLEDLDISESEKYVVMNILDKYRKEAFRQYLDTSCSMRVYDFMSINTHVENRWDEQSIKEKWIGKLSILLRDLNKWLTYSDITINQVALPVVEIIPNIKAFQFSETVATNSLLKKYSSLDIASNMLVLCESHLASQDIASLLASDESVLVKDFCFFIDFQKTVPRDDWFNIWISVFSESWATKRMGRSEVYRRLAECKTVYEADSHTYAREWWTQSKRTSVEPGSDNIDLLSILLNSNSVEEFSIKTGLSVDESNKLLKKISHKCKLMLD